MDSRRLRRLADDRSVEHEAGDLCHLMEVAPIEHYAVAAVCSWVPGAIVCLLSDFGVPGLQTQLSRDVRTENDRLHEVPTEVDADREPEPRGHDIGGSE